MDQGEANKFWNVQVQNLEFYSSSSQIKHIIMFYLGI